MQNRLKSTKLQKKILATFVALTLAPNLWADSPPNPSKNIPWLIDGKDLHASDTIIPLSFGTGDVTPVIEAVFNAGRREEEKQLGLIANTIKDLDLPAESVWKALKDEQKALFLLNDERTARAGMKTGVIGLPFAGVEENVDMIAKEYTGILIRDSTVGHNKPSNDPAIDGYFARLAKSATLKDCHQNIARGENVAWYGSVGGDSIPLALERAIYQWIYDDATPTVGAPWGHREMALLQDKPLVDSGVPGFNNDDGSTTHEGYIGFQSTGSKDYQPFGAGKTTFSQAIVLQFFDPKPEAGNCAYSVTYKTEDLPANKPPVANNDTVTTAFNKASATIKVLDNDTDPDNDTMTVTANTSPSKGTVVKTGNTFVYTPNKDYSGSDSFNYTLSDGKLTATATVSITVNANGVPVAANDKVTVTFNKPSDVIKVLDNDSDPEGGTLSVTKKTDPSKGSIKQTDNTFIYTPNKDYSGPDSFTYTLSDGTLTSVGTVNITVNPNAGPTAVTDAITTEFNTPTAAIKVLANDSDAEGDTMTVTSNTAPTKGGTVVKTDNTFVYTPKADFSGVDSFTYNVSDGNIESTGTVNVTVKAKAAESSGGGSIGLGMFGIAILGFVGLVRRKLKLPVQ